MGDGKAAAQFETMYAEGFEPLAGAPHTKCVSVRMPVHDPPLKVIVVLHEEAQPFAPVTVAL